MHWQGLRFDGTSPEAKRRTRAVCNPAEQSTARARVVGAACVGGADLSERVARPHAGLHVQAGLRTKAILDPGTLRRGAGVDAARLRELVDVDGSAWPRTCAATHMTLVRTRSVSS